MQKPGKYDPRILDYMEDVKDQVKTCVVALTFW